MAAARKILAHPLAQLALGALVLLGPALINRAPYLFPDTGTYAQAGFRVLDAFAGRAHPTPDIADSYLAARSPFYGLPFALIVQAGTVWAMAVAQALAAAFTLRLTARAVCPNNRERTYAALIVTLAFGSALAFFVAFMTPDVFAGVAVALAALLALYPETLNTRERALAWTLLVASLTFHATHAMTALIVVPAMIAVQFFRSRKAGTRTLRLAGSALAAALVLMAFSAGANSLRPAPQHAPPFVTARLLADGPGRVWLRQACARDANAYVLCMFKDQALDSDEAILWSGAVGVGVFSVSDVNLRLALIAEQPGFVRDVVLHYPVQSALGALRNTGAQLVNFGLSNDYVMRPESWLGFAASFYPRQILERIGCTAAAACGARPSLQVLTWIHAAVLVLSLGALVAAFAARGRVAPSEERTRFWLLAAVIVAGVAINAALCGAISGPYARYQARIVWLIPMLAILAEARFPLLLPAAQRLLRRPA